MAGSEESTQQIYANDALIYLTNLLGAANVKERLALV